MGLETSVSDFFKDILAEHDIEPEAQPIAEPEPPAEFVPPPRIQSPYRENSDPVSFHIGAWDWDRPWWWRLALPWPRWPEPGAVATPEIEATYDREHDLAFRARQMLWDYLWFVATEHLHPGFFEVGINNSRELANERLAWLKGVWSSRGMRCPDEDEFIAMAIEPKPPIPSRPAGTGREKEKDAEGNGSSGRTNPA